MGIICLSRENLEAPSIHFEAGALSNRLGKAGLTPYCLDLVPAETRGPFSDFQGVTADKAGTLKMLKSINSATSASLSDAQLIKCSDLHWPELEKSLQAVPAPGSTKDLAPVQAPNEMIAEVLERVRSIERGMLNRRVPQTGMSGAAVLARFAALTLARSLTLPIGATVARESKSFHAQPDRAGSRTCSQWPTRSRRRLASSSIPAETLTRTAFATVLACHRPPRTDAIPAAFKNSAGLLCVNLPVA